MNKVWSFLEKHRFTFAALALAATLAGCSLWNPTVSSPIDGTPVTRPQLVALAEGVVAKFEAAEMELADKEALKLKLVSVVTQLSAGITDPLGLVPTLLGVLAVGASGDNIRKNRKITELKTALNGHANGATETK